MKSLSKKIILGLSLVVVLLIIILAMLLKPSMANVHFIMPDTEEIISVKTGESCEFPIAKEYSGYTFLGWEDSNGNNVHSPGAIFSDTYFIAKYGMALDTDSHLSFLVADNAYFRPKDAFTRGEAVSMLYALLNTDLKGTSSFLDIESTDSLYIPASLLKDLGVLSGEYLHPDDFLTENEFFDLLSNFFPIDLLSSFSHSDNLITREDVAVIMCKLLGRYGDSNNNYDMVGELSDVQTSDKNYWYIAEACVQHECFGEGLSEIWTNSVPCIRTENGFYFVGYDLHYIDNDGHTVTNTKIGNIEFDKDGAWTSGDKALDVQIKQILKENVDPQTQTRLEMLRILYNHVRDDYDYCYGQDYLPGQTGWANKEAIKMLDRKIGNCYRFAGLFAVLARSIGFDAEECCGVMDKDSNLHSWVEINIDGTQYLFDPQYEARFPLGIEEFDRYMKTGDIFKRYNAMREYREKYN